MIGYWPNVKGVLAVWEDVELCWPASAPKPPGREPCWIWLVSTPKSPGTFFGTLLNVTWLCTKASQTSIGTFSAFPQPSSEPRWSWGGFARRLPGTSSGNFSRILLNPTWFSTEPRRTCTSAHRSYFGLKTLLAYAVGGKHGVSRSGCRPNISPM